MMVELFYHLIHFRAVTASSWISNQIFEVSLCLLYSVTWDCLITRANGLIDFPHIWEIMQCFSVQTLFNINLESILERLFWRMSANPLTLTLKCVGAVVLGEFLHFFTIKNFISGDMAAVSVSFPVQTNQCEYKMWLGHLGLDLHFHYWVQIS